MYNRTLSYAKEAEMKVVLGPFDSSGSPPARPSDSDVAEEKEKDEDT